MSTPFDMIEVEPGTIQEPEGLIDENEELLDDEIPEEDFSLSDDEVAGFIWDYIEQCEGHDDDEVANTRQQTLDYWMGRKYGNEKRGFSKVVTREVFETVEWSMPTFVRMFLSGDTVVKFGANSPQDAEAAGFETEIMQKLVLEDECSYENFEMFFRACLLYPNAYLKIWVEEDDDYEDAHVKGLTQTQVGLIQQNPRWELLYAEMTSQVPMPIYDVGVREVTERVKLHIECVPPEEVLVLDSATKLNLDKSKFVCHHSTPTRSDLLEMGHDRNMIWDLPSADSQEDNEEIQQRKEPETTTSNTNSAERASDEVDYYECYVHMDVDGDGIQEFRKICMGGNSSNKSMFENEETDYMPLVAGTCYGVPFAHRGLSVGSTAQENQLVTSTILRQLLDNLYRTNRPRTFAGRGVNINQLNTYTPHGVVEMKDVNQITTEQIPPVVQQIMPTFEYLSVDREGTTGVTKHAQGMDARTLADSSMTSYVNALGQASQRLEAIGRFWGETTFVKVFKKAHYLMRTYQNVQEQMEIAGRWVDVDPMNWRNRSHATCVVGLGTGSTQEKIAGTLSILDLQERMGAQGLSSKERMFNTLTDLIRTMNRGSVDKYFLNPASPEAKQNDEQARQQSEQQAEMMRQAMMAQIEDIKAGNEIDMQKLTKDYEEMLLEHEQQMTKLELEYDTNVPGSAV